MDLAFYTYFYGSDRNDSYRIPDVPSIQYNCYFYTNNLKLFKQLGDTKWIRIYDNKPSKDDMIESCMIGKYIKALPHEYQSLAKHHYLCYFDTKIPYKINVEFVEQSIKRYFVQDSYALLLRHHWFIDGDIWDEFKVSMDQVRYQKQKKQYIDYINEQINSGLSATTESHCATGFLIRNMRHSRIREVNEVWYNHIKHCGIQCQIAFFFVKQIFPRELILPFRQVPYIQ